MNQIGMLTRTGTGTQIQVLKKIIRIGKIIPIVLGRTMINMGTLTHTAMSALVAMTIIGKMIPGTMGQMSQVTTQVKYDMCGVM